ncbi:MAG: tRNA glutamyl-Q(34) synthetase GluQRS [Actinomycetota bacterium]|nr:tRNA glutamyl-Q(34) synthetase GluQRS [Acidimicrobiales bacterium]MEC8976896.1 tRNA glutamyl-Q(34) synthetase GluQRS [Actinomycetota bacterium]MEC9338841.1 tRNA glutamyl-Q(34) synthetase GluQRS [Actinomycetota bacterium]MED5173009.1 tRNA glutamyl-Q(34) synthetase GluQRS [Actinomycetota bacterium]MED6304859.1 tRNA glutamyl-Q(34) synthetase GluQRS [Actinomycetota bacterium]
MTGRWAPSPTGHFHLGNLRTALLAWLFARSSASRFIWRFEDLDAAVRPEFYRSQIRDYERIGLDWDGEPVRQSDRLDVYRDAIEQLTHQGLTYRCWCTRREIREATVAQHSHLPEGAYSGICRNLTRRQIAEREASGRSPALRLRTNGELIKMQDRQLGTFEGAVDDFVLCRGDGVPSYNLGVVVDDADLGVTEVVRGDDLLPSTPRQIHLFGLLGLAPPSYAHVPLVVSSSGERLAKRHGAVTIEDRLTLGESEFDVLNTLLSSLRINQVASFGELRERAKDFDPSSLPVTPWVFDR